MKPLSKEANAALSALEPADPTSEDEARVRKNLERALGVAIPVAGVAAATTATSAQAATSVFSAMGAGAKVAVFIAVTAVTATVAVSLSPKASERREAERARPQVQEAAKRVVEPEIEVELEPPPEVVAVPPPVVAVAPMPAKSNPQPKPVEAVTPVPAPVAEPEAATPPPPATTPETWDLEVEANFPKCDAVTELASAQKAQSLLKAERAEDAVWLMGAYQRRCPSGRWSNEAWSVRMAGLCKLGRTAEVIGLLQWFSAEYPGRRAAVVNDLRSSCSEDVLKPEQ